MYDKQIFALIKRYIVDPDAANDVYQDVFLSAYKNLNSFKFNAEFYTWLYRITVNTCLSAVKSEKRHNKEELSEEMAIQKEKIDSFDVEEIIKAAQKLPEKQKMVFFMRFQNDLKISEIADALHIDSGTVKGYLSRSIDKIRLELSI